MQTSRLQGQPVSLVAAHGPPPNKHKNHVSLRDFPPAAQAQLSIAMTSPSRDQEVPSVLLAMAKC